MGLVRCCVAPKGEPSPASEGVVPALLLDSRGVFFQIDAAKIVFEPVAVSF
jgi:hypothetical protein